MPKTFYHIQYSNWILPDFPHILPGTCLSLIVSNMCLLLPYSNTWRGAGALGTYQFSVSRAPPHRESCRLLSLYMACMSFACTLAEGSYFLRPIVSRLLLRCVRFDTASESFLSFSAALCFVRSFFSSSSSAWIWWSPAIKKKTQQKCRQHLLFVAQGTNRNA